MRPRSARLSRSRKRSLPSVMALSRTASAFRGWSTVRNAWRFLVMNGSTHIPAPADLSPVSHRSRDQSATSHIATAYGSTRRPKFELDRNTFLGLNGGPVFKLGPTTSFIVSCGTQTIIDHSWSRLSEGDKPGRCGWIDRDRFGLRSPHSLNTPPGAAMRWQTGPASPHTSCQVH